MIKAVIFDLDGTLTNTIEDIADAANYALSKQNLPLRSLEVYRSIVGNGIVDLLTRASNGVKGEAFDRLKSDFFSVYGSDKTVAYDGMRELVGELKSRGYKVAVVTNKEHNSAVEVVKRFYGDSFDIIRGNVEGVPVKPDPTLTLAVMKELGVKAEECIFIGDSGVDILTGKNSGAVPVGETWGYRKKEELIECGARYIIDKPEELLSVIEKL